MKTYHKGQRVKVYNKTFEYWENQDAEFEGIIQNTLASVQHPMTHIQDYMHHKYFVIHVDGDKPVSSSGWYMDEDMILIDEDTKKGEKIIKKFRS